MKKKEPYKKEARTMISPVLPEAESNEKDIDNRKKQSYLANLRILVRRWTRMALE